MATHSSTVAWKIPWMESVVGYHPWGHKESDTTEHLNIHTILLSGFAIGLVLDAMVISKLQFLYHLLDTSIECAAHLFSHYI